jgi:hypothetical protein
VDYLGGDGGGIEQDLTVISLLDKELDCVNYAASKDYIRIFMPLSPLYHAFASSYKYVSIKMRRKPCNFIFYETVINVFKRACKLRTC